MDMSHKILNLLKPWTYYKQLHSQTFESSSPLSSSHFLSLLAKSLSIQVQQVFVDTLPSIYL